MAQKVGNLSVKTGEYVNAQNETKGRYENAGTLMQGDDGGFYVILKKTFNPAGVNGGDGKDSIILSVYQDQNNQQQPQNNQGGYNQNQPPVYQENQQGHQQQYNQQQGGYNQQQPY